MNCPRCGSFVFQEHEDFGGTEFSCISGHSWLERPGIPILDDPTFRNHVREGGLRPRKTLEAQERAYEMRQAQQRIQNMRQRLKRQGLAAP